MLTYLLAFSLTSKARKLFWFIPARDRDRRLIALSQGSCSVLIELSWVDDKDATWVACKLEICAVVRACVWEVDKAWMPSADNCRICVYVRDLSWPLLNAFICVFFRLWICSVPSPSNLIMLMPDKIEVSINAILITGRLVIWSMVMAPICPPVKPAIDSGWIKVTLKLVLQFLKYSMHWSRLSSMLRRCLLYSQAKSGYKTSLK